MSGFRITPRPAWRIIFEGRALKCLELNLDVTIRGDSGHAMVTVKITADHMTQSHEFIFSIDQTYFKPLIAECRKILSDYPIKGAGDQPGP
jgi:hypothetical protein